MLISTLLLFSETSVKGLEDEEVQFLNFVSNRQMQIEKERANEEKSVIAELRISFLNIFTFIMELSSK